MSYVEPQTASPRRDSIIDLNEKLRSHRNQEAATTSTEPSVIPRDPRDKEMRSSELPERRIESLLPNPTEGTPVIEIEVVHEHGTAPRTQRQWKTVDIWTRNRIYTLDSTLRCIEVTDRVSGKHDLHHPFLGYLLVGGQKVMGGATEVSYPFPRPGSEAVFQQRNDTGNFSRTSAVKRVVMRLHVLTVSPTSIIPTWEQISDSLQ